MAITEINEGFKLIYRKGLRDVTNLIETMHEADIESKEKLAVIDGILREVLMKDKHDLFLAKGGRVSVRYHYENGELKRLEIL